MLKSSNRKIIEATEYFDLPFFIREEIYKYDKRAQEEHWRLGKLHSEWNDIINQHQNIIIKAPRDHLKTFFFSESYPLRRLRYNSEDEIQLFSKTDKLAVRILDRIKKRIEKNPNLQYLGGKGADFWSKTEIRCSNGATMYAQGFWSSIRGGHPKLIILDDVIDSQVIYSDEQNEKAKERLASEILPMAEPDTQIIIVGTLQREDDIYSVKGENFFNKTYDAIVDEKNHITLFPEKWDWERLMKRKAEITELKGEKWFLKEYRNMPVRLIGEIIKREWIQFYDEAPEGLSVYQGWDLSVGKDPEKGDYTACITIGIDEKDNIYVLDVYRDRIDFPTRLRKVVEFAQRWKPKRIGIESNTFQADSVQVLKSNTNLPIEGIKTTENKIRKFNEELAPLFENGKVFFRRGDSMQEVFINELLSLPRGEFDEMCDGLCIAIKNVIGKKTSISFDWI